MRTLTRLPRPILLDQIWQDMKAYRELPILIWDSRDHGNFSGTYFEQQRDTLRQEDVNHLCEGLLLDAMINGILKSTKVTLDTLLRHPGNLNDLQHILTIQARLHEAMRDDMTAFSERIHNVFHDIKPGTTCPDQAIIAICLRDALHSLSSGLTWSWLEYDNNTPVADLRLNKAVLQFDSMTALVDALRTDMPFGVHLVNVQKYVVLTIKQPGRIGYLSALALSEHTGNYEQVNNAYSMRAFDFDVPANRFPSWSEFKRDTQTPATTALHPSVWGSLTDMPAPTVIWLVLLTELLQDRLDRLQVNADELIDVAGRALPGATSNSSLPAILQPRFSLAPLSIEWGLSQLEFNTWEKAFIAPVLSGLPADFFCPPGTGKVWVDLPAVYASTTSRNMEFVTFNPDLIGSEARVSEVRRSVFLKNLATFALAAGNNLLDARWSELKEVWKPLVAKRAKRLPLPSFTTLIREDRRDHASMVVYKQNPKRVQFAPLCLFDERTPASHYLLMAPENSAELADMLGLQHENLPDWLQGWSRDSGTWTCSDRKQPGCAENVQLNVRRWRFSTEPMFSAVVATTEITGQNQLRQ